MFACILFFIFILPVSFVLVTVEGFFTSEELSEMGVHLKKPYMLETL